MDAARQPAPIPSPPKTRATDADVEKIAELLIAARSPVILTETVGRIRAFAALVELADLFAIRSAARRFCNFPKNHPLHRGTGIQPF